MQDWEIWKFRRWFAKWIHKIKNFFRNDSIAVRPFLLAMITFNFQMCFSKKIEYITRHSVETSTFWEMKFICVLVILLSNKVRFCPTDYQRGEKYLHRILPCWENKRKCTKRISEFGELFTLHPAMCFLSFIIIILVITSHRLIARCDQLSVLLGSTCSQFLSSFSFYRR